MTTKQFLSNYTIPHLQVFEQMGGEFINGLMMLKSNTKYYTTVRGWAFCLPRKFKKVISSFTPECNIPVLEDNRFVEWAKKWAWETTEYRAEEDGIECAKFLQNITGKPAIHLCSELLEKLTKNKSWGHFSLVNEKKDKPSRAAFLMSDCGWEFGDWFPSIEQEKIDGMTYFKEHNDIRFKEPFELEDGIEFMQMLKNFADHIVVCPFVFPELILDRPDGDIYFINTPDTVYFSIHRSI